MNAIFGGITVFVPKKWKMIIEVNSVFASFNDKRYLQEVKDLNKKVIITDSCVLGNGEIRNYFFILKYIYKIIAE